MMLEPSFLIFDAYYYALVFCTIPSTLVSTPQRCILWCFLVSDALPHGIMMYYTWHSSFNCWALQIVLSFNVQHPFFVFHSIAFCFVLYVDLALRSSNNRCSLLFSMKKLRELARYALMLKRTGMPTDNTVSVRRDNTQPCTSKSGRLQ